MAADPTLSTLQPVVPSVARQVSLVPVLTILHHALPERVGDEAWLKQDGQVVLSRLEPRFVAPGAALGRPLDEPYLSRTPMYLVRAGQGVRVEPAESIPLTINGEVTRAPRAFGPADLDRGVVLELSSRVVLLLHRRAEHGDCGRTLGLIGASAPIEQLRADILRLADLAMPVLVRGETGSGKELTARALHESGPRAMRPFIAVNVAATPVTTAASELFGHVAGAFTGAVKNHPGHFVQAAGGTLFLDEVGALPLDVQAMLLRVVETGECRPLGSRTTSKANVRLVSATDADLEEAMAAGRFREALYHRLAGYRLVVPPLRDRLEDLGRLLHHFFAQELADAGEPDKMRLMASQPSLYLPTTLVARLCRCPWPGNVRQLRNLVRHLVVSSRSMPLVQVDSIIEALIEEQEEQDAKPPPAASQGGKVTEGELIAALEANAWRTTAAAQQLGISRTTLYALIDKSSRVRKAKDISRDELEESLRLSGGDLEVMSARLKVSMHGLKLRLAEEKLVG